MKILVVGGAGYIGSHLTYALCDYGYDVKVLDDLSSGFIENIDKRSDFIHESMTNSKVLSSILKDIDCVIHLAALKAAGESMFDPIKYSKKNLINSIELINDCIDNNVKNFLFSSSAAVYGYPEYLPIDEKHPLKPINYYGFSKLMIEKQLLWYSKLKALNIGCLRYFNACGYDINGRVTMKEKNPQNLLPIVMEVASGSKKQLSVFGNDYNTEDGTCLRDYIHVNDLARAHLKAIEKIKDNSAMITNVATGNSHSVLDVINKAEMITNKKIHYIIDERREGDPDKLYASSNNILNYQNQYSDLETIIKSMWKVYRN